MLETLKNRDHSEVEKLLSNLIDSFLPSPRSDRHLCASPLHLQVLDEVRNKLKVSESDHSIETTFRILNLLSEEISQVALSTSDLSSLKNKLGERGELRPDLYDITFLHSFEASEVHGTRKGHVVEAIRSPDQLQHLFAPTETWKEEAEAMGLSIYIKRHNREDSSKFFSLVVVARRRGCSLEVFNAWRIYHNEVRIPPERTPLDLLRGLAEHYGYTLTISGSESKFFMYEILTNIKSFSPWDIAKIHTENGRIWSNMFFTQGRIHGVVKLMIAFVLDGSKYARDLKRHGVQVSENCDVFDAS